MATTSSSPKPPKEGASAAVPPRIDVPDDPFGEGYDDRRLWIGNLDLRMTEFAVLKMVQKFGAIRKMDFIYHKGGPDKGKSKGYCFVSFHTWEAAEEARKGLDGFWCLGRPMYVKWAHSSKYDDFPVPQSESKNVSGTSSSASSSSTSASAQAALLSPPSDAPPKTKIEAIEAKLKMMEQTQKDFGINDTIRPPPGGTPLTVSQQRPDASRSHRSHPYPYRRGQTSRGRFHR